MYHVLGLEENLRNVVLLGKLAPGADAKGVRAAYRDYLATRQEAVTLGDGTGPRFISDWPSMKALLALYDGEGADVGGWLPLDAALAEERARAGFYGFGAVDRDLQGLLELAINVVFLHPSRSRGGGSTPRGLGVIWCNPADRWSGEDMREFYVHELTHNLLFLDEVCRPHYANRTKLADPDTFVTSSIRHTKRPLDLAFHSLAVAAEVLAYRERHGKHRGETGLHPGSPALLGQARRTWEEIGAAEGLLAPRGRQLVGIIGETLKRISA